MPYVSPAIAFAAPYVHSAVKFLTTSTKITAAFFTTPIGATALAAGITLIALGIFVVKHRASHAEQPEAEQPKVEQPKAEQPKIPGYRQLLRSQPNKRKNPQHPFLDQTPTPTSPTTHEIAERGPRKNTSRAHRNKIKAREEKIKAQEEKTRREHTQNYKRECELTGTPVSTALLNAIANGAVSYPKALANQRIADAHFRNVQLRPNQRTTGFPPQI